MWFGRGHSHTISGAKGSFPWGQSGDWGGWRAVTVWDWKRGCPIHMSKRMRGLGWKEEDQLPREAPSWLWGSKAEDACFSLLTCNARNMAPTASSTSLLFLISQITISSFVIISVCEFPLFSTPHQICHVADTSFVSFNLACWVNWVNYFLLILETGFFSVAQTGGQWRHHNLPSLRIAETAHSWMHTMVNPLLAVGSWANHPDLYTSCRHLYCQLLWGLND